MNSEEDTTMTNNDEEPITPNNGHLNDDSVGITPSPGNLSTSHVTQDTPNQASNNAPDSTKSIETSDSRKAGTPPAAVDTSVKTPSESKDHDVPMYEYGSGKPLAQTPTANTPVPPPPVLPQPHHSQLRPLNPQQHPFKSRPLDFPHESPPKKKRRKNAGVQSLPFLRNFSNISKILLEQENRAYNRKYNQHAGETKVVSSKQKAPQEVNVQVWQPAEVINFFRGVYLHGWGEWRRVCRMIQTRNNQQAKTHAQKLEKRFPELRTFFSVEKVKKMHERYGKVCRYEDGTESVTQPQETNARQKNNNGVAKSLTKRKEKITAPDENAIMAASVMKSLRQSGSRPSPPRRIVGKSLSQNVPKVTFCLGKYAIDTDASLSTKRTADSANPPAAPFTSSINIFIPGSRVYARWLDKEDPDSYGTWYPGYLTASKSDPGGENGSSDIPRLLYHITFDDGTCGIICTLFICIMYLIFNLYSNISP